MRELVPKWNSPSPVKLLSTLVLLSVGADGCPNFQSGISGASSNARKVSTQNERILTHFKSPSPDRATRWFQKVFLGNGRGILALYLLNLSLIGWLPLPRRKRRTIH